MMSRLTYMMPQTFSVPFCRGSRRRSYPHVISELIAKFGSSKAKPPIIGVTGTGGAGKVFAR